MAAVKRRWHDVFDAGVDAVVERAICRALWPMVGAGLCSLLAVGLGMWLGWDRLVTAGFVLGYAVAAWGGAAFWFLIAVLVVDRWLQPPGGGSPT